MKRTSWLGWLELILGILLLLAGVYTVFRPEEALIWVAVFCGFLAVVCGILDLAFYVRMTRRTGFGPVAALVTGILGILDGIALASQPYLGSWILLWLFPIWMVVHCASRLAHLSAVRRLVGPGYCTGSLVLNILGLAAGVALFLFPYATSLVLHISMVMVSVVGACMALLGAEAVLVAIGMLLHRD